MLRKPTVASGLHDNSLIDGGKPRLQSELKRTEIGKTYVLITELSTLYLGKEKPAGLIRRVLESEMFYQGFAGNAKLHRIRDTSSTGVNSPKKPSSEH